MVIKHISPSFFFKGGGGIVLAHFFFFFFFNPYDVRCVELAAKYISPFDAFRFVSALKNSSAFKRITESLSRIKYSNEKNPFFRVILVNGDLFLESE